MIFSTLRRTLTNNTLLSSVITVTSLIAGADACCQVIEHKGLKDFNWIRFRNMSSMGCFYYGPLYFYYYRFLDRKFPGKNPRTIAIKMFIDQVIYTIPSLTMFFIITGKLEHKTWEENKAELRKKFIPTYATASLFWPAAQCVNFVFVPPTYRVLYISGASFIWLICLSYIKNRPKLPGILQVIEDYTTGNRKKDIDIL